MMHKNKDKPIPKQRIGRLVVSFNTIDSTNNFAAELAADADNDGLVVLANEQTAGRGQHGRDWQAPPGTSVLMSVLLFPPPCLRRPAVLTAWAAVSVCDLIQETIGVEAKIKWPNDVLIRGRKVCGILIEQRSAGGNLATVVGIGLNVNQSMQSFVDAGLTEAASLAVFSGRPFNCREVAQRLIRGLDAEYLRLEQGDLGPLESCWKWRLGLLGKQVTVEAVTGIYQGRLRDISFNSMELELASKETLTLEPARIRHLTS